MRNNKGFTLIELIIVLALLLIIAGIAVPRYLIHIENAKEHTCRINRYRIMEALELQYSMKGKYDFEEILASEGNGYFILSPECPAEGVYTIKEVDGEIIVSCSIHEGEAKLTPLGNNFIEISEGFKLLTEDFFEENGRYPRTWGIYKYSDLGLSEEDFSDPVEHIYYESNGNRFGISPEEGYTMSVLNNNGIRKSFTSRTNWNILYSYENEKWYFKEINPDNEVDIETLEVKK